MIFKSLSYRLPPCDRKQRQAIAAACAEHGANIAVWRNKTTKVRTLDVQPHLNWKQAELDRFEATLEGAGIRLERIA